MTVELFIKNVIRNFYVDFIGRKDANKNFIFSFFSYRKIDRKKNIFEVDFCQMNQGIRFIKRQIISPFLFHTGLLKLLRSKPESNIIVNFHGVKVEKYNPLNKRHLDRETFIQILQYLKKEFYIAPIGELVSAKEELSERPLSKPRAFLTFDDGYLNNFTIAAPILNEMNIPATYFIVTASLHDKNFINWPDVVDFIIYKDLRRCKFSFGDFTARGGFSYDLNMSLSDYIKKSGIRLTAILNEIQSVFPETENEIHNFKPFVRMVDAETLSRFKDSPVLDFGSHTHTHYCLEHLPEDLQLEELSRSRQLLESVLQRSVNFVAYPDGSYNASTLKLSQQVGYKHAFVVNYRMGEQQTPAYYKPRFTISNSTNFYSNMNRLFYQYPKFAF